MADRESSSLPSAGLVAAVVLLTGAVIVKQLPLTASRPISSETAVSRSAIEQDVDARLWQDPFAAAGEHQEDLYKSKDGVRVSPTQAATAQHQPFDLPLQAASADEMVVVVAPVFGGPRVDEAEHRRRTRYAMLSGLNVSEDKYVPDEAEHIGYFELPDPPSPRRHGLPEIVPYEWFRSAREGDLTKPVRSKRLVLLWFDEWGLTDKPLRKIGDVLSRLKVPCGSISQLRLKVIVLGPVSSGTVRAMYEESARLPEASVPAGAGSSNPYDCVRNASVYSYSATASAAQITQTSTKRVENDDALAKPFLQALNITFLRTIQTDQFVLEELVRELDRRSIGTKALETHIALISEWDSLYGQKFRDSLSFALCNGRPTGELKRCDNRIHQFSYMRGLDGVVSKPPAPRQAKDSAEPPLKLTATPALERAEGDSQADYLRRLADHMRRSAEHMPKGETLRAVGVVGTDVYDKLLVLQGLRPHFPNAVFFTTDLDARLLHPEQFSSARNLIVASSFGLRFHPAFQRDVPPFRDSYQASAFFATRLAMTRSDEVNVAIEQGRINGWLRTRVFEIGRNRAFDLSPIRSPGKSEPVGSRCDDFPNCETIHPQRDDFVPHLHDVSMWIPMSAIGMGLLLAYGGSRRLRQSVAFGFTWISTNKRRVYVGILACGALLAVLVYVGRMIAQEGDAGEPLVFATGISIWPTEMIRAVASVLGVAFIIKILSEVARTTQSLNRNFFPTSHDAARARLRARDLVTRGKAREAWKTVYAIGGVTTPTASCVDAKALWRNYNIQSSLLSRALRIVPFGILFYAFAGTIVNMLGVPSVPARGSVSAHVDWYLLFVVCVPVIILLLFVVVDVTRQCGGFIRDISLEIPTKWPDDAGKRFRGSRVIAEEDLCRWLDICFIADWTETIGRLFYYPFSIIVLMIAARSAIFDNWATPLGLLIVFGLTLVYTVGCGLYLRACAEAARAVAVGHLMSSLIKTKGEGDGHRAAAEQLTLMVAEVKAMRRGAFAPLTEQRLIRAALLPLSGASGIALMEYLLLGR